MSGFFQKIKNYLSGVKEKQPENESDIDQAENQYYAEKERMNQNPEENSVNLCPKCTSGKDEDKYCHIHNTIHQKKEEPNPIHQFEEKKNILENPNELDFPNVHSSDKKNVNGGLTKKCKPTR